jgi:hypothetical protein
MKIKPEKNHTGIKIAIGTRAIKGTISWSMQTVLILLRAHIAHSI